MMDIPLQDPKKWYRSYKKLSDEEKYVFLCETVKSAISDDFFDELTEVLSGYFENLFRAKKYKKMIDLYETIDGNKPQIRRQKKFYYIDRLFIDYFLFQKETGNLGKYLASFLADPVESVDLLVPVLDKLVFYGQLDYALDISRNVYSLVRDSDRLIGRAERDFDTVILFSELQGIYEKLKNNQPLDLQKVADRLAEYDFDIYDALDDIIQIMKLDYRHIGRDQLASLNKNELFFRNLGLLFKIYMFEEKSVNFTAGYEFWNFAVYHCFSDAQIGKEIDEYQFNDIFRFDEQECDADISARLGFISNKRPHGVAVSWGVQYVYDFLLANRLISNDVHRQALAGIKRIRGEVIEADLDELWIYDFVHTWGMPTSYDAEEYEAEKDLFATSFSQDVEIYSGP
jgi:hypothetical protein